MQDPNLKRPLSHDDTQEQPPLKKLKINPAETFSKSNDEFDVSVSENETFFEASDTLGDEIVEKLVQLGHNFKSITIHAFRRELISLLTNPAIKKLKEELEAEFSKISSGENQINNYALKKDIKDQISIWDEYQKTYERLRTPSSQTLYGKLYSVFKEFLIECGISPLYFETSLSEPGFQLKTPLKLLAGCCNPESINFIISYILQGMARRQYEEMQSPQPSPHDHPLRFFNDSLTKKVLPILNAVSTFQNDLLKCRQINSRLFLEIGLTYGASNHTNFMKQLNLLKNIIIERIEEFKSWLDVSCETLNAGFKDIENIIASGKAGECLPFLSTKMKSLILLKEKILHQHTCLNSFKEELDLLENALNNNTRPLHEEFVTDLFTRSVANECSKTADEARELVTSCGSTRLLIRKLSFTCNNNPNENSNQYIINNVLMGYVERVNTLEKIKTELLQYTHGSTLS